MASWIHVFSKFTSEALLFEALAICLLCASYAAFWVLRKRRYGVIGMSTPAHAVKSYLNQLILDAEQMRIQLFGILAGTGVDPNLIAALRASSGASVGSPAMAAALGGAIPTISPEALAANPDLAAKFQALEAKLAEQNKVIESITTEKTRVEKELVELRSGKDGAPASGGGATDPKLAEKIAALEAKLAEYSVIEDDLANLKRLQQENTQLKAQLGGKAPATAATAGAPAVAEAPKPAAAEVAAAPVAEAAAVAEAPAAAAPEEAAAAEAAAAATDAAIAEAAAAPAAAEPAAVAEAEPAVAAPAAVEAVVAPTADPQFEGLVDQVEQSLADAPAGASVEDPNAPAAAPSADVAAASAAATAPTDKSDADLVAEFEKMLNS